MYSGPWYEIDNAHFIDWPPYHQETSIVDLANRLIVEYKINQDDIIIGSSMGGIVGLEIANIIRVKRIILIGSAVSSNELSFLSKALMPLSRKSIVKISQFISSLSKDLIQQMYSKSDPDFIVSMSKAILNWQGYKGDRNIFARIHGKKDHFIKCPDNCEIIDKGGHLIAMSHSRECVDFIKKQLQQHRRV